MVRLIRALIGGACFVMAARWAWAAWRYDRTTRELVKVWEGTTALGDPLRLRVSPLTPLEHAAHVRELPRVFVDAWAPSPASDG